MEEHNPNREKSLEKHVEIPYDAKFTPLERELAMMYTMRITDYPGAPPCSVEVFLGTYYRMLREHFG